MLSAIWNDPKELPPDPATEFAVVDPVIYHNDRAFIASINLEPRKFPKEQCDVLFCMHGCNNTASDAVLRLAQVAQDNKFEGAGQLQSIILVSPDIDMDLFRSQLDQIENPETRPCATSS